MNEKEFLIKFLDHINSAIFNYEWPVGDREIAIDEFLRIFHMKYRQVYFYEWAGKEKDIMKEQVKIKLKDFLVNQFDFLDYDWMEKKVDEYVERMDI